MKFQISAKRNTRKPRKINTRDLIVIAYDPYMESIFMCLELELNYYGHIEL